MCPFGSRRPVRVQTQTSRLSCRTTALPPTTDIERLRRHVRFVPKTESDELATVEDRRSVVQRML